MPILSNPRHERFAQELAKGKSATQAYIEAGYEPNRHNAARLNTNEHIADRVKEILKAGAERAEVTVERVVREWARIGFADIRNAVNWHALTTELAEADEYGTPKTQTVNEVALVGSDEIDFDTARAIAEISQTKEGALKVKFHDKKGALDSMARHLGMFVDKTEIHHTHGDLSDADLDVRLAAAATAAGLAGDPETTH